MRSRLKSLTIKVRVATLEPSGASPGGLEDGARASLLLMHAVLGYHLSSVVSAADREAARIRSEESAAASDLAVKVRVPAYYPLGAHLAETAVSLRHKRLAAYIQLGQEFAAGSVSIGAGDGVGATPAATPPTSRMPAIEKAHGPTSSAGKMSAPNVDVLDEGLLSSLTEY